MSRNVILNRHLHVIFKSTLGLISFKIYTFRSSTKTKQNSSIYCFVWHLYILRLYMPYNFHFLNFNDGTSRRFDVVSIKFTFADHQKMNLFKMHHLFFIDLLHSQTFFYVYKHGIDHHVLFNGMRKKKKH